MWGKCGEKFLVIQRISIKYYLCIKQFTHYPNNHWCYENGKTTNRPFDKFPIEECLYGTPVYISLDEREQIWNADLSARPQLAIQRDIFIFQSVIGCRVSDLYRMTKQSIVNGAIEYIPKKTKKDDP